MRPIHFTLLWRHSDWGLYGRRHEVFGRELARHPDVGSVVHIEAVSPKQILNHFRGWRSASTEALRDARARQLRKVIPPTRLAESANNLYVTSFVIATKRNYPASVAAFNEHIVRWQARRFARARRRLLPGRHCTVAYLPAPYIRTALNVLPTDFLVADLIDDVPAQVEDDRLRHGYRESYRRVLPKCDWAISTSQHVAETFQPYANGDIDVIRNGVRINDFSHAENERPSGVGYVGNINQTMNVDLVDSVTKQFPDTIFKFAGPVHPSIKSKIDSLQTRPNIEFIGALAKSEVPAFLRQCRVLFSIKRNDDITSGNDSMKIYEYLATGRPVVSTPVSPADRLSDVVYTAYDKKEFVEKLRQALTEDNPDRIQRRLEVACENAWEKRIDSFVNAVLSKLN
jgi:glycosyltransferase involved in cell wall biosynthesis